MEAMVDEYATEQANRRYGKYRGFVADNQDPEQRARLKLRVPSVLASATTNWALPCLPYGGLAEQGLFLVPDIGAQVWVEFEEGQLDYPLWVGTFWQSKDDVPKDAAKEEPTVRMLQTPSGHKLVFDDTSDEERVTVCHSAGATVDIDPKGTVLIEDASGEVLRLDAENAETVLTDSNGNTLTMSGSGTLIEDSNGNTVELAASGITVKAQKVVVSGSQVMLGGEGGEPVIKGQSFVTFYSTHVHPTGVGPSGPPIPQGEMSTLSMKVTSA